MQFQIEIAAVVTFAGALGHFLLPEKGASLCKIAFGAGLLALLLK